MAFVGSTTTETGRAAVGGRLGSRLPMWRRVRWFHRFRLVAAAALAATAVASTVTSSGDVDLTGGRTVSVLVAARDLPAGVVLTSTDVGTGQLLPRSVPDGVLREGATVVGRTLSGALRRGTVLTDVALLGAEHTVLSAGPGTVAVPLRLAQPGIAALARPGARVDVLAVDESSSVAAQVARDVVVLAVAGPAADGAAPDATILVVAVPTPQATGLVRATLRGRLAVTLRGH
jgi:Flp pilus assembly protein CpaB